MIKLDRRIIAAIIIAGAAIVAALIPWWLSRGPTAAENSLASETPPQGDSVEIRFPFAVGSYYFPSGWMGDGEFGTEYLSLDEVSANVKGAAKVVYRIRYQSGPKGWAGIYWQYPDSNWGDVQGRVLTGAGRVFWLAKGERGDEIVEFKAGGIRGTFPDSFEISLGKVVLSNDWKEYVIDLTNQDLSNVVGAFAWVAEGVPGQTITLYVGELRVE